MELETLKEEAAKIGYRLSKIPEKDPAAVLKGKKTKRAVYVQCPPQYVIRSDIDKEDMEFLTCTEGHIKVLEKLFPSELAS